MAATLIGRRSGIEAAQFKFTDHFTQADGALRGPWTGASVNRFTVAGGKATFIPAVGAFSTIKTRTPHNYVQVTYDSFVASAAGSCSLYVHMTCSAAAPTGAGSLFLQALISPGSSSIQTVFLTFFDGSALRPLGSVNGPTKPPLVLGLGWDGVSGGCLISVNGAINFAGLGGFVPSGDGCGMHSAVSSGGILTATASDFHVATCNGYANLPA